jgi:hypothetical protein
MFETAETASSCTGAGTRAGTGADIAAEIRRGLRRMMADHGYGTLSEFRLASGRRVDVIGLNAEGIFAVVEIKSSIEDFRADRKWHEYLGFCERFYFAVPEQFPTEAIPPHCGLIVADGFGAAIRRDSEPLKLNANRKRRMLVSFAMVAAARLHRLSDPGLDPGLGPALHRHPISVV